MGHDAVALHARACARFGELVSQVGPEQWALPTPCPDWNVRVLVDHVVRWNLAVPRQFAGDTIKQLAVDLGDDVLGDDPVEAWRRSAAAATEAFAAPGALEKIVNTALGNVPGVQLAVFRFDDNLIHGWDLARALGLPDRLDPELATVLHELIEPTAGMLPATGFFAVPPSLPADADVEARLLAMHGRDAVRWSAPGSG